MKIDSDQADHQLLSYLRAGQAEQASAARPTRAA